MSITFEAPAAFVSDMAAARKFYEDILGQTVQFAVGDAYTAYEGGFSIWGAAGATEMIFGKATKDTGPQGKDNFELYFESEDLDAAWIEVEKSGAPVVHDIRAMPWAQRCFRVKDPDGHLVEVGEPMPLVIKRLAEQGLSDAEVSQRTMVPEELVKQLKNA